MLLLLGKFILMTLSIFIELQKMAYFPSQLQAYPRLLWQPVVVQQLPNETIQQLKRENDFLKRKIKQVLHTNRCGLSFQVESQFTSPSDYNTFQPFNSSYSTRRQAKNTFYSPEFRYHDSRLSSKRSSDLRTYFSPEKLVQTRDLKENDCYEATKLQRMVISKGKDGKYYRLPKEKQQSQSILSNKFSKKMSTAENSQVFSPVTTPTRISKELKEILQFTVQQKPNAKRLKSPSFLKKNAGESMPRSQKSRSDFMQNLKKQLSLSLNKPIMKRLHEVQQPIIEQQKQHQSKNEQMSQDDKNYKISQQKEQKAHRKECRVVTLDLSYECDSNLSIERKLREIKRDQRGSDCDLMLKQIERNLDKLSKIHQKC